MTVSLVDGPLGLEATHRLGGVTMNAEGTYPLIRVKQVTGLHGSADADDPRDPATGRIGEIPTYAQLRGKDVTYSGTIYALTLPSLRATVSALRREASNFLPGAITITPHPTWGTVVYTIFGRPAPRGFTCDDHQASGTGNPSPYQRDFVLTFRMSDPRAFALALPVSGGAAAGVAATIAPGGTAPTEPVFTINGPASGDIDLVHVGQSKLLRLSGLTLGGSDVLTVSFPTRTALVAGVDVTGRINWGASNWWDEDAYGLSAASQSVRVDGAASWAVTCAPAAY